jgi:demethylmenaquinone methyltransferase/2-methoxy-6-polyprenyl-1,4-benzoquinol methylase
MSILPDYSRQASTYDSTRAASPSVLAPLRHALRGAPGRRLADIGGGTGNYALALQREGWQPLVLDRSAAMVARAAAKGLRITYGDALALPFADASFDAAMLVSMLHHTGDPPHALAEACRILVPKGRLAVMIFTREDVSENWLLDYFPSSGPWIDKSHTPLAQLLSLLPGATRVEVTFDDVVDGSLAALSNRPELILDSHWRRQTSYFERMERDHAEELGRGLHRLALDLAAGRRPQGRGIASVLTWRKDG